MLWNHMHEKVDMLVTELAMIVARKSIWCVLQWRIIHDQQTRRKRSFLMNYLILRQRQKLFLNLYFTLGKICRVENGFRKFIIFLMMNQLNHVSEYQEKYLNYFESYKTPFGT